MRPPTNTDTKAVGSDRWLLVLAVAVVALSAAFRIIENDVWWHIRAGQWIWENGITTADPFSHASSGPWRNSDWLAQLFFFAMDRLGGAHALVWGKVALVGLLALLLAKTSAVSAGSRAAALCLVILCMHMRLLVMPELFSFLFFTALILFFRRAEKGLAGPWLLLLPAVIAVWSNFHRAAMLGVAIEAAALVAFAGDGEKRRLLPWLAGATLLSVPALAANPGGWATLNSTLDVAGSAALRANVAEWAPFSLTLPWPSVRIFFGVFAAWAAGWLVFRRRADFSFWLCAGTVAMGFYSVRMVPFAAMAIFAPLSEWLERLLTAVKAFTGTAVRPALWGVLATATGIAGVMAFFVVNYPVAAYGSGLADWLLPVDAANFLRQNPPPGKMWNPLNPSGYLLYALSPRIKVSIDGRADTVYGWDYYQECLEAPRDANALYRQFDRLSISFAVIEMLSPEPAGYRRLARDPDWVPVFIGDHQAIVVKRTALSQSYLERVGLRVLRLDTDVKSVLNSFDKQKVNDFVRDVLENLKRAPNSLRAHTLAAVVFRHLGRQGEYLAERATVRKMAARRGVAAPLP